MKVAGQACCLPLIPVREPAAGPRPVHLVFENVTGEFYSGSR
jgi:hypothetical protein